MINTKNRENLYLKLTSLDLVTKLKPLLDKQGYMLRLEDAKFVPRLASLAEESPWVYVKDANARCDIYNKVFYQCLHHIHSRCRRCWKVVVRPRTILELLDLYELEKEMGVPCKCGIEVRETVNGFYGGYFYCQHEQEAQVRYQQVRQVVDKHINPNVKIILKRMCTEFELGTPPGGDGKHRPTTDISRHVTEEELTWEYDIEQLFPPVGYRNPQPDYLTAHTIIRWIHWAHSHGDMSYLDLTGGEKLYRDVVTYHDKGE